MKHEPIATQNRPCSVRFEFEFPGAPRDVPRTDDGRYVAVYNYFSVAGHEDFYRLSIGLFDA